jgi:hypothetical protein
MSDYSKLFVAEKTINNANIDQNMKDVLEYSKLLTGNTSTMLRSSGKTLGRVYAYNTNEMCVDYATLKQVPRHSVIDAMNSNANGFLNSANSDFEKSKADIDYVTNSDKFPRQCMSVPIIETDIDGKSTTNPYYIMIAEIDKLPDSLFPGGKKPSLPIVVPPITTAATTAAATTAAATTATATTATATTAAATKEKFVSSLNIKNLASLETMDAGQTFFIGSLGVIGLYMYFKMAYGHSK